MHRPKTDKLRLFQAGNHAENAALFGPFHPRLKADHIVEGGVKIILPQLNDRIRFFIGAVWIDKANRLHRPKGKRLRPTTDHLLDRKTPLKKLGPVKVVHFRQLGLRDCFHEIFILLSRHRAIEIVSIGYITAPVARGAEGDIHFDARSLHNRRNRIVKIKKGFTRRLFDPLAQRVGGQRAGGNQNTTCPDFLSGFQVHNNALFTRCEVDRLVFKPRNKRKLLQGRGD